MTLANTESKSQIIRILAISGSLRQISSNTALLQAAIALSPKSIANAGMSGELQAAIVVFANAIQQFHSKAVTL